jgi:hypothetical protein
VYGNASIWRRGLKLSLFSYGNKGTHLSVYVCVYCMYLYVVACGALTPYSLRPSNI